MTESRRYTSSGGEGQERIWGWLSVQTVMIYKVHKTPFSELTVEAMNMMENRLRLSWKVGRAQAERPGRWLWTVALVEQSTENLGGTVRRAFWLGRAKLGDPVGDATGAEISFSSLGFYRKTEFVFWSQLDGLKQGVMTSKLSIRTITSYPVWGRHWW